MNIQRQSDMILRLLDSSQAVEDSVTFHGPLVARKLEERYAPRIAELEGGGRPDFLATMFALRDELAASRRKLAADEERHIDVLRQITNLSLEREDLFGSLQDDITWLRGNIESLLGSGNADVLAGIQGPTAVGSAKLLRQVRIAIDQLSKPDLKLPPPRFGAIRVDAAGIARQLKTKADRFREVRRGLRRLNRQAEVTRTDKNHTVVRHRQTFYPTCKTLEGLYRLAGEEELADQIRPSNRRRGRRAIEIEGLLEGPTADGPAPEADPGEAR